MEKKKITQRCRKVSIPVAANRIFLDEREGSDYDFLQVFRNKEDALKTVAAKHDYVYHKQKRESVKARGCRLLFSLCEGCRVTTGSVKIVDFNALLKTFPEHAFFRRYYWWQSIVTNSARKDL